MLRASFCGYFIRPVLQLNWCLFFSQYAETENLKEVAKRNVEVWTEERKQNKKLIKQTEVFMQFNLTNMTKLEDKFG